MQIPDALQNSMVVSGNALNLEDYQNIQTSNPDLKSAKWTHLCQTELKTSGKDGVYS